MKKTEQGFEFYEEKCIQCHGCETACKTWNSIDLGLRLRKVINVWEGKYPQIKSTSISLSCLHCTDPACISVCRTKAIIKNAKGVVKVVKENCIGCKLCLKACPFDVPQFGKENIMQICNMCEPIPPCVRTCPTGALNIVNMALEVKKAQEKSVIQKFSKMEVS